MTHKLYIAFFVILALAFKSCSSDDVVNQDLNGEYTGTFTKIDVSGETYTNPVTVVFSGENNYKSSGNSNYVPAGGSGTYEKGNSTITFSDINHWTTNFDPNLILAGEYEYSLNGNSLTISAERSVFGTYTYVLVKD